MSRELDDILRSIWEPTIRAPSLFSLDPDSLPLLYEPGFLFTQPAPMSASTRDAPKSVQEALKNIDSVMRSIPRPSFDCIVCTVAMAFRIRTMLGPGDLDVFGNIMGIPLYQEATQEDALARCLTLQGEGKKPLLVKEEDQE